MCIPELLKPHFQKTVGIFGYGVSGKAVAQILERLGVSYMIYDKAGNPGSYTHFTRETVMKHSLIVYSPGFPKNHHWLELANASGCLCLNELDFGSLFWTGKIIAITGTNGKSTLTCLLAEALKCSGKNAVACGNLGIPLSSQYEYNQDPNAIAVCEVSSFQAETTHYFSPDVLIWTTFDTDHLDRHPNLQSYFDAKWKLVSSLKTQELFIGETVLKYANKYGYSFPINSTVVYNDNIASTSLPNGMFATSPQLGNYLLALAYWVSQDLDIEILKKVATHFQPLAHRLSLSAEINGIEFWNDSKGTNSSATIAALQGFKKNIFWIGGGKLKGGNQTIFADDISLYIDEAFLIGEAAPILENELKKHKIRVQCFFTLEEAIQTAYHRASLESEKKKIVFSPGFSSFDMFKNAEERGIFFEKKVLELKTAQNTLKITQAH